MRKMTRIVAALMGILLVLVAADSIAQDRNIAFPIAELEQLLTHDNGRRLLTPSSTTPSECASASATAQLVGITQLR